MSFRILGSWGNLLAYKLFYSDEVGSFFSSDLSCESRDKSSRLIAGSSLPASKFSVGTRQNISMAFLPVYTNNFSIPQQRHEAFSPLSCDIAAQIYFCYIEISPFFIISIIIIISVFFSLSSILFVQFGLKYKPDTAFILLLV